MGLFVSLHRNHGRNGRFGPDDTWRHRGAAPTRARACRSLASAGAVPIEPPPLTGGTPAPMAKEGEHDGGLLALPAELLAEVLDILPPLDLLHLCATSTWMRAVFLTDHVWQPRLQALLKRHLCLNWRFSTGDDLPLRPDGPYPGGPGWIGHHPANINFVASAACSFFKAVHDRMRTAVTREELTSFEYCFRFKAAAGDSWIQRDPWWNNRPPVKLKLGADGTVRPVSDAQPFWGAAGQVSGRWQFEPGVWSSRSLPPDQREADTASVVTMNGHPSYTVRRHPEHWGVFIESCWCVWTAFEMAPKGHDLAMEDEALRVFADEPRQRREVERYNSAVNGGWMDVD